MDTRRFLRKPLDTLKGFDEKFFQVVLSPNNLYKVIFSHYYEFRMGSGICCFTLLDNSDNIIDNFEPITAIGSYRSKWSDDSKYFVVAIESAEDGYFIIKFPERDFSFIKIRNPYPLEIQILNEELTISYNDKQVALSNSAQTIGDGISQTPKKKFLKPQDLKFNLADLKFHKREELGNIQNLIESETNYDLKLIPDGYFKFTGIFPQSTEQVYHNKPMQVYQLEDFAEYGDEKSREWLEEIKRITSNKFNRYVSVSSYLGYKQR